MPILLTKTDYILWRECKKNVWLKIHKPHIYQQAELTEFEKQIIETGNDVEEVARQLFPGGRLIEGRGVKGQQETQDLINKKERVLFQPVFLKDGFLAAVDILVARSDGSYDIYEVKSTSDIDKKTHFHDLTFQVVLLERCGLKIHSAYLIHLNSEYVRQGELNIPQLFTMENITEKVNEMKEEVANEMQMALTYLSQETEPLGYCDCVYKGRSNHCNTFAYSNPKVPEYGVHDITRIGLSKGKLQELIDVGIFELQDVPDHLDLSPAQKNQIETYLFDKVLQDRPNIKKEIHSLQFPLYFLDYETFPSAIPRFDGFSPYQQIPFQYSLYVLEKPGAQLLHHEFLHLQNTDPSQAFIESLQGNISDTGSIIVWNKGFECKINAEVAKRLAQYKNVVEAINARVYDLMDIFSKQFYVHKDFRGRVSIKNVLPVLVPELSYQELEIKEGGSASQAWNQMVQNGMTPEQKETIAKNLKTYCGLDTYAMYAIWKHLYELVN